jgi:ABC-type lipoprotein release transport system permease subunit
MIFLRKYLSISRFLLNFCIVSIFVGVTILEYAVSMHNKKGEVSRKKKALETISQLEINTNNNEEILREAQAKRRGSFLRYMAANYIQ